MLNPPCACCYPSPVFSQPFSLQVPTSMPFYGFQHGCFYPGFPMPSPYIFYAPPLPLNGRILQGYPINYPPLPASFAPHAYCYSPPIQTAPLVTRQPTACLIPQPSPAFLAPSNVKRVKGRVRYAQNSWRKGKKGKKSKKAQNPPPFSNNSSSRNRTLSCPATSDSYSPSPSPVLTPPPSPHSPQSPVLRRQHYSLSKTPPPYPHSSVSPVSQQQDCTLPKTPPSSPCSAACPIASQEHRFFSPCISRPTPQPPSPDIPRSLETQNSFSEEASQHSKYRRYSSPFSFGFPLSASALF